MPRPASAIVAIPVRNEAERIAACLDALANQDDIRGLSVFLLLNGCTDATLRVAQTIAPALPFPLLLHEARLPAGHAHAGEARGRAMDAAAAMLEGMGAPDGLLLTTDADSRVAQDWLSATRAAIAAGADAVAGQVTYDAAEIALLPPALRQRIALEAEYDSLLARIESLVAPMPHDPWPRHRMASGASLALRLGTYRRVGGLPRLPVGEDRALVAALAQAGARIRHATSVRVVTSCRLDGRAAEGAAATLCRWLVRPDAACDAALPPLRQLLRGRRGLPPASAALTPSALVTEIRRARRLLRLLDRRPTVTA
jgi:hypothetical protein